MAPGTEIDGRKIRVDYSITQRAHTPTPGVYLGRPSEWELAHCICVLHVDYNALTLTTVDGVAFINVHWTRSGK